LRDGEGRNKTGAATIRFGGYVPPRLLKLSGIS
jgi:hypothetical protein